jgi:hypothetical protein
MPASKVSLRFVAEHCFRLMALNADDGPANGLCDLQVAGEIIRKADEQARPDCGYDEFEALLIEEGWGKEFPDPPARPTPTKYFLPVRVDCAPMDDKLTSVVPANSLLRILSQNDRDRFSTRFGIDLPRQYTVETGARWIPLLAVLPAAERIFTMDEHISHGRPFVWLTQNSEFARAQDAAAGGAVADVFRDRLGLIHHKPLIRNLPNHLFALHLPKSVVNRCGHWRPSFVEGLDNRRFRANTASKPSDWGKTVDLAGFAEGGSERVLCRLQRDMFASGERIEFEYLGRVEFTRGTTVGVDDDPSFLVNVARGRHIDSLLQQI